MYHPLIVLPSYLYVPTSIKFVHHIWPMVGRKTPLNLRSYSSSSTYSSVPSLDMPIELHMNKHHYEIHFNISQIPLNWYTHRGDHIYQSFRVSGSLLDACSSLHCGSTYNPTGGRFTTGTGLYASIFSFVDRTTARWPAPSFSIAACVARDIYVDALSTSLYLNISVVLLYQKSISH